MPLFRLLGSPEVSLTPCQVPAAQGIFHMYSNAICPPDSLTVLLERVISSLVAVLTLPDIGDGAACQLSPTHCEQAP